MNGRRVAALAVLAALLCAAGFALWRSAANAGTGDADQVAASLRCLTCEGQSVADSPSPVAAGMREVIAEQLAAGRTPDEIRDWFVERYGAEVLASPPPDGIGALLWVLPAVALLAGLLLAARTVRRRAVTAEREPQGGAWSGKLANRAWYVAAFAVVGLVAAVAAAGAAVAPDPPAAAPATSRPADPVAEQLSRGQRLEQQGDFASAADAYRAAAQLRPEPRIQLHLAFALLRAEQPAEAAKVAGEVLAERPDDPEALLMLGLAQRAERSPEAVPTLRRFVRLAPDHPAAAEIRRLIRES